MANWFTKYFRNNVKFQDVDRVVAVGTTGGYYSPANVIVDTDSANKLSTFYSCVRNISEDLAKQQIKILRNDSKGNKTLANGHNTYKLLNLTPNKFCNPLTFRETIIKDALERGNGFAFIERDNDGYPIALYNLDPLYVIPKLINRKMWYVINDAYLGIYGTYSSDDVFHLRGLGNGYVGISVLKHASVSLGKSIATQNFSAEYFGGGASMTGLLELTNVKDEAQAAKVKKAFQESYKNDGLGVIGGQTKFTKLNFTADEAQMLDSQEFNVNDVCRWFRMPLSKVQKSEKIENIEALNIEYVNDCLSAWQTRFEQEVEAKLFDSNEKQLYDVKFDNSDLLRGDTAAQERRFKTLYFTGAINANEIRRDCDMNTIGAVGDKYMTPVNMIPSDLLEMFWEGKSQSNIDTSSADSTGSGNTNNNIKQNGTN